MSASVPETIEEAVRRTLADAYGIDAKLARLPGENRNYAVSCRDGRRFVAKIAGDQQPPGFVALEQAALAHAKAAGITLHLPQIHENKFGKIETVFSVSNKSRKRLRLIEFITGKAWSETNDISDDLRFDLGRNLAQFVRAMRDFDHPEAHRTHRWDLTRLDQHRPTLEQVADPRKHELLIGTMNQWTNQISPVLDRLSRQFIHGDANPENLLVENGRLAGLIDFGDCCRNPPICELAICLAYQMMEQDDPWAAARPVIAGWESVLPLSDDERRILPGLICGRFANTLCVATERRALAPDHPNWFVSEAGAWRCLATLQRAARAAT